jgi:hypothetical protein
MKNKGVLIVVGLMFLFAVAVVNFSDEKKPDGRALYKEYCKVCHAPGSQNGEYSPMSLIEDQWGRFFNEKFEKSHKDLILKDKEGKKLFDLLTPEMRESIKKFCMEHAADSEHPMTCG